MNERPHLSAQPHSMARPLLLVGKGKFAQQLSVALRAQGGRHEVVEQCPADLSAYAGLVTVDDVVDRQAVLASAERAMRQECPLLPFLLMGEVAQIGPLTRSGPAGACVLCADTRMAVLTGRSALDAAWPMTDDLRRHLVPHTAALLADWSAAMERFTNQLTFVWSNGGQSAHPVLRTVACPLCAEQAPVMPFCVPRIFQIDPKAEPDQERILRLEDRLVDPMTGPIKSVEQLEQPPGVPSICHTVATLADPGWARSGFATLDCGGNELEPARSRAAALGEAIERATASEVWPGHLTVGSWDELGPQALDPLSFDLFLPADRQRAGFPYAAPSRAERRHWIWGTDLTRAQPVLVPASQVFVPFTPPAEEAVTDYPLLSGFAAGASRESALLSALLEVVERDSFMIAWANRLRLQPVDLEDGGALAHLRGIFEDVGVEVRVGLIQLDLGAPVAIAMARSDVAGHPGLVVAAAAAMSRWSACEKALTELTANWLNVHHTLAGTPPPTDAEPAHIRDETAHGLLYARPEMRAEVDVWWHSDAAPLRLTKELRAAHPPGQSCAALIHTMAAAGLGPTVVDLTMPAMAELGLFTVKCVVPGAYPMNFDALWPHLGGRRMIETPVRVGLRSAPSPEAALNRVPHPFP
ncbi:YcaO-like family protein [Roseobacter sinensis]|uniref:YcaO-like family protein n=1 Tax=Roseobacter sinensis TaxID=2931391 RepID=A0ABT3BGZ4_9RHOB|nr:YcaO-like family protein [Roseobacter sp. WL0113]MCV3272810.1 YcaO-like family protein [Roseobacter sp. WL0113]